MVAQSPTTIPPLRPQYPIGIPSKFSPDGVVQRYPGNTILCHIPAGSPLLTSLRAIHAAVSSHPTFSKTVHLLPPESWHMTVLDGIREKECEPGMWPLGKEKQPLGDCTKVFAQNLRKLGLELEKEGLAPPYRMRVRGFDAAVVGIGIEIEGSTTEEEQRMRRVRDKLADALGFKAPNHETYQFHVSMAYLLRHVDGEDREELNQIFAQHLPSLVQDFELGALEFCTFENMYEFPRLFYLGEREGEA